MQLYVFVNNVFQLIIVKYSNIYNQNVGASNALLDTLLLLFNINVANQLDYVSNIVQNALALYVNQLLNANHNRYVNALNAIQAFLFRLLIIDVVN